MSKLIEQLIEKEKKLEEDLNKEQQTNLLVFIKKPDGVKNALEYQYDTIDVLSTKTLEQYLGALSQYLVYINKYINILVSQKKTAVSFMSRKMSYAMYINGDSLKSLKSISEKEGFVKQKDPELLEVEEYIDTLDAKIALYNNIPDSVSNLIQTIKKIYDNRMRETQFQR